MAALLVRLALRDLDAETGGSAVVSPGEKRDFYPDVERESAKRDGAASA